MNKLNFVYASMALCAVFLLSCENHESVLPAAEGSPGVSQTKFNIQGVVVTDGGTSCEGAQVELRLSGEKTGVCLITDSGGRFVFNNVKKGAYTIDISKTGFTSAAIAKFNLVDKSKSAEQSSAVCLTSKSTLDQEITITH